MKKLLGIIVLGLMLSGCFGASFTPDANRYVNTSESKLCIGYYESLITGNIHASAKREMIELQPNICDV